MRKRRSEGRNALEEIESLYRTRFDDFARVAVAIADSFEDGRDAVHDAFVSAVREIDGYRGDGPLEAWLWRIVVTSAKAHRRRRRSLPAAEPPEAIWIDRNEADSEFIRARIAALPERQRLIVFLRYYADLDYRTIAEVAGIRVGTVGAELHVAHRSLGRCLQEVDLGGAEA